MRIFNSAGLRFDIIKNKKWGGQRKQNPMLCRDVWHVVVVPNTDDSHYKAISKKCQNSLARQLLFYD